MELIILFAIALAIYIIYQKSNSKKKLENIVVEDTKTYDFNKRVVRKKKSKSPEENKINEERYIEELRENGRQTFLRDKNNAKKVGSKKYIWRSCEDDVVCSVCAKNNGKKFDFDKAPAHGHPGSSDACTEGYCRCYAEPIIL
jgi:hypothetical protein